MSEVEVTVVVPEPEPEPEPVLVVEPSPVITDPVEVSEEEIQNQLDEVEQWRTQLTETQRTQGETLNSLVASLGEMSGAIKTLLTLAQPNPPSEEEEDPQEVENQPEPESPMEPEAEPEPEPPPPRKTGRQWM